MSAQNPTATFVLSIEATTGYEAQTEGTCTPEQYGAAIAVLHGKPTPCEEELLTALRRLLCAADAQAITQAITLDERAAARAAIAKATGGAL